MASSRAASRARALRWPASSRSTPTPPTPERPVGGVGRQRPASSSPGRATARTARDAASSPSVSVRRPRPRHRRQRRGRAPHRWAPRSALPVRLPRRHAHQRRGRHRRLHPLQRGRRSRPISMAIVLPSAARRGGPPRQRVPGQYLHLRAIRPAPRSRPAANGGFVVAWSSSTRTARAPASSPAASRARALALASRVSGQLLHRRTSRSSRRWPSDAGGGFVVAWQSFCQDYSVRRLRPPFLERRRLRSPASSRSTPTPHFAPVRPVGGGGRRGGFVVAWESGQDGSEQRRLRPPLLDPRRYARQRVPGQHLHHRRASVSIGGDAPPTETSSSPGRAIGQDGSRHRYLRAPVLEPGTGLAASSRSTPTP